MNEYVITFRRLKSICEHKTMGVHGYRLRTSHACMKKLTMGWVKTDNPARYIECRETNCPIIAKCDPLIS